MKSKRLQIGSALWLLGAIALLVFHVSLWLEIRRGRPLRLPDTPADLTNPLYAVQWHFLMDARAWVPDGITYTVAAPDMDSEMSLFMLALAVYPKARGVPNSYYGYRRPEIAREAAVVLDESCAESGRSELTVLARLPGGCVERRR